MKLETLRIGEGPRTTVVLHGFMGSGKNLRTFAQRWLELDPGRTFLLPDLRGHGTSPALEPQTKLADLAADVFDTVRAEGLPLPVDIVGHSLGGRVGLAATLVEPSSVGNLVLLDISPSPIPSDRSESGSVLATLVEAPPSAPDRRAFKSWFVGKGLSPGISDWLLMNVVEEGEGYVWRFDRQALSRLHSQVNPEDLWPALEKVASRTLVLRGSRSKYVSDADVQRLERAGAQVQTLEGAGHFVHVDALEPLLAAVSGQRR